MAGADSTPLGGLLTMRQACEILNCHANTLRSYANSGKIDTYRIGSTGKRRFLREDVLRLGGLEKTSEKNEGEQHPRIILYARISDNKRSKGYSKGEASDLSRQVERLKQFAIEEYGEANPVVLAETGSGLSFQRKQFNRLIDGLLNGTYRGSVILLTHPERLCRVARELVLKLIEFANCKIVYTEAEDVIEDESPGVLIAEFCSSVISRIYSKRSAERYKKRVSPDLMRRIFDLRSSGQSVAQIARIVNAEGFRTEDGAAVGIGPLVRILNERPQLEQRQANSVSEYFSACIQFGDGNLRIKKETLYDDYCKFCKSRQIEPLNSHHVGRKLTQLGVETVLVHDRKSGTKLAWRAIEIKQKEKLSFVVKPKPRRHKIEDEGGETTFAKYYWAELRGSGKKIFSRQLFYEYKAWCKANRLKPQKFNTIAPQLMQLGGHYSVKYAINGQGGMRYTF